MADVLHVLREFRGTPEHVGALDGGAFPSFRYDGDYLASGHAAPLSAVLPLQDAPFDLGRTQAFFEGLVPEGSRRANLARVLRGDGSAYPRLLSQLSDETVGAVVFSKSPDVDWDNRRYEPLDGAWACRFAENPDAVSLDTALYTRMSLAGAQGKVGLYRDGDAWFLPLGFAPSNWIVKAANPVFPSETLNEAICLRTAALLGLEVETFELLDTGDENDPLLAVERFDRADPPDGLPADAVDEHRVPWRLHQEDFCQLASIAPDMKYEPTDGHYLSLVARTVQGHSTDPTGDRVLAFERVCFDYAIGNCGNHLKNRSLLYDASWSRPMLSPVYDVVATTRYPRLLREMGVGLCASRRIDDVAPDDIARAAGAMGVPAVVAYGLVENLAENLSRCVAQAGGEFDRQGFAGSEGLAGEIAADAAPRCEVLARADELLRAGNH